MNKHFLRLVIVAVFGLSAGCGSNSNAPALPPANPSLENTATDGGGPPDLGILQQRHSAKK